MDIFLLVLRIRQWEKGWMCLRWVQPSSRARISSIYLCISLSMSISVYLSISLCVAIPLVLCIRQWEKDWTYLQWALPSSRARGSSFHIYLSVNIFAYMGDGGPARNAAIGPRRRPPPQAPRYIQGSSPKALKATLGSFPCACVLVPPLYRNRLSISIHISIHICPLVLCMRRWEKDWTCLRWALPSSRVRGSYVYLSICVYRCLCPYMSICLYLCLCHFPSFFALSNGRKTGRACGEYSCLHACGEVLSIYLSVYIVVYVHIYLSVYIFVYATSPRSLH